MRIPKQAVKKIAILRALQLGDMLCAMPAIKSLRKAYPDAEIVLLGLPWAESFVARFHQYIDRFIHFPGYPGLPEQVADEKKWQSFIEQLAKEQFDLVLQMQGNGTIVNRMIEAWPVKYKAGFESAEATTGKITFMPYPEHVAEVNRHILLMQHLGITTKSPALFFPLTEKDYQDFDKLMLPLVVNRFVCIHPGSRGAWRQWPPKYFAALADYCAEQGFTVVITGTDNEADIVREVVKCMKHHALELTGKTNLGSLGVLLEKTAMLICNCTGVSHMADALHTPSIVISMDGEPNRWGPLDRQLHRVIDWTTEPRFEKVFEETVDLLHTCAIERKQAV